MAKRLFSWVLVLALVLSMIPAITLGISAEDSLDKHTSHDGWTEWTDKTKLPTAAGQYYLSVDVELTSAWYPNKEIHLCLNGHDITQKTAGQRVLGVANGGILSVYDCTATTDKDGIYTAGQLTGGSQTIGAGVNVNRGGVFNLYGGKITGNHKAGTNGGGVYLQAATDAGKTAGMFNMYGGQICGNSSKLGAGVYVAGGLAGEAYTNAVFNMYGGIIGGYGEGEANVAETDGGAIYACTYGAVNIQGGKIVGNKAKYGAAIYAGDSIELTVKNAKITGNTTSSQGTIWLKGNVTLAVDGSEITGNTAPVASAIYAQNNVVVTIKDSTITENIGSDTSAEGYGAALYLCSANTKVTVSGKTRIADNVMANEAIADLFINSNAEGAPNEVLYVKDLDGYVKFGVKDKAATLTEASEIVAFDGAASSYAGASVSYMAGTEEKHVALVDGAFKFVEGHYHEGMLYQPWTKTDELPDGNGEAGVGYYLTDNVTISTTANRSVVDSGKTLHLCLNGKTVSQSIANAGSSESSELIRVSTGSLYLDDCTTVYDENGYFVSGGKLTGANKKGNGSAIYINKAVSIVEVTGIEISGNNSTVTSAAYGGAGVMARYNTTPAKFIGCKFADNTATSAGAGAIAARDGGSFLAEKCYFYHNQAKFGGALYIYESTATLKDCVFEANTASDSGGAVHMATNTSKTTTNTVVFDGCTFKNNSAANAGAVNILGVSNVTVADTSITGNTNTSTAGYGAVNLGNSNAVVKLQGDTVISDNLNKAGAQQNLHLQQYEGVDYDLSGLGANAKVGVSLLDDRIEAGYMYFSTTGMTAVPAGVTSDDDTYEVYVDDQGRLALKTKDAGGTDPEPPAADTHTHKLCNDSACTSHGDAITFEKWTDTTTLPTAGNYYLDVDVNLTAAVDATGDLNLCLNGHTVKQTTAEKRLLRSTNGFTLSVTDCGTTGKLTGGTATYGSAVSVRHGSTFNLFAGKITGNTSESEGTVYIQGGNDTTAAGVFNMYGGEISGNTTKMGGAISAAAPGTGALEVPQINIYGGKITGNTTTNRGSAINASGTADIYIENAEISGNTSGGDGTIYATTGPTLTVKNTKIKNNNAKSGAAISTYGGTLTLDGAVIQGNHSTNGYSAVHPAVSSAAGTPTVVLKGATVITDNTDGADKVPMNLYLRNNVAVDVSGLTDAAKIGLTRHSDRAQERVSKAPLAAAAELNRFESDDALCSVDQDAEGYLVLLQGGAHVHKLCNDASCTAHGGDVSFKKWTDAESLPTSGNYYLDVDVNLTTVSYVDKNSDLVLCLNGHTIKQTGVARVLQTQTGSTLTITDCGTTGTITGGRNDTGASIFVTDSTTFNLYAGKITGSAPKTNGNATSGSAIFLRSTSGAGATMNMYGGEITGNGDAMCWAGAIGNGSGNANNVVYLNIYGGKIYGNTAGTGGAIRMMNKSVTTIYGGEIYGNEATDRGGAIYLSSGSPELVIKGGKIYDNTASNGGAIFASSGAKITIEGDPTIYNNTASDKQNNLYLAGKDVITLGALADTAKIGVGAATINRAITTAYDTDYATKFLPDNSSLTVSYKEKALWLEKVETSDHYHKVCADVAHGTCEHDKDQMWIKWGDDEEEKTTLPTTSGYYYLTQDIQLTSYQLMETKQDIYLCLNGKTVTAPKNNRHFATNNGTTVSVTDCSANPGGFTGGSRTYGGSVNVIAGSTFNLYAGKFYGNTAPDNEGGAIYMQAGKEGSNGNYIDGGTFNMYGGEIYGNTAKTGAGVRTAGTNFPDNAKPSTFNMYGGKIYDNHAVPTVTVDPETQEETKSGGQGGGVAITYGTVMNLYGGEISGNSAYIDGGAIYMVADSDLHIKDTKITGNSSGTTGGGIFSSGKGSTITMDGGEISGNTTTSGGGVITQTMTVFTMNGGTITGNKATSGGGGIYVSTNTDFILNGGAVSGNTAKTGGGFYALRSRAKLNGGEVADNKASYRAGGFASAGGTIEINKATIKGNEAPEGGAAYIYRTSVEKSDGSYVYYPSTVNINDGALITANKGTSNTGGLLMANDGVVVTMNGGEISKNTSANGAGFMTWRGSTFIVKGGKITGNVAKNCGGGGYVSTASTFKMEGGSISGNKAKSGGGLYVYRSQADFLGGTVSNNRAQHTSTWKNGKETKSGGTAGGMYISGAKVNLKGTSFTGNYGSVNGGAIMMGRATYTEGGVKKIDFVTVNYSAGLFSGNKTEGAGGAMLIQSEGTVVNMYGGTVTGNEAKNAGGIYVSTKTKFNMTGGSIVRNKASASGGGLYFLNSTGNITGGQIHSNSAATSAGNMMVSGASPASLVTVKNIKFHDGTAKTAGSVVVQSKGARMIAENCDFYDNASTSSAGAVYVSTRALADFTNCKFYSNTAGFSAGALYMANFSEVTVTGCDFTENVSADRGGAIFTCPGTEISITDTNFSKCTATLNGGAMIIFATAYLTNVTVENCVAEYGGAVATQPNNAGGVGVRDGVVVKNSVFRNNIASSQGGAFYIWKGRPLHMYDSKVTGNTAGLEGGAIWSYEDVQLHDSTITGNTSGGEGFAVYMNDANYDGHSYYTSKNKLSGDVIIKDNNGGDMWMGPDVTFGITPDGLGENVHIELTLDSGVVTQRILGAYHYEGGNQVYTITYGDRSMTDPEIDPSLIIPDEATPDNTDANKKASGDTWLYVGIGIFAALIIAIGVILVAKKKKAGNAAEKASK